MDRIDQAFWQLFHAVAAKLAEAERQGTLTPSHPNEDDVTIALSGPVHAVGVLRREAEQRGVSYPDLIASLSEERRSDLPDWWLAIARDGTIGALP
jgi:hypothetical protein